MCLRCLLENHQDCVKHVLEIDNIFKGDLALNLNWLKHEEIKTAVKLIKKYDLNNQVQVLETSEKRVEEEFAKLKNHLNDEINRAKDLVLKNLRERQSNDVQFNLKTFTKKMEEFYGFDTLVGIIESIKNNNQNDVETINIVLESFFTSLNDKKNGSDADLETKSRALGKYLKDVIELDTSLFDKAKSNLSMKLFENCLKGSPTWTWNPDDKSKSIILSENNMLAQGTSGNNAVAFGTIEMSEGVHKWEVAITTGSPENYWIAVGIVDKNLLKSWNGPDNFDYGQTYGFDTEGGVYQVAKLNSLLQYDNQRYVFELDMGKGSFTISCDGNVFLQVGGEIDSNKIVSKLRRKRSLQPQILLGKTFIPYVNFWSPTNKALLKIL